LAILAASNDLTSRFIAGVILSRRFRTIAINPDGM
jgi:hypothetical protein